MAMTREEARAAALKLRAMKPELQRMNLDSLIAKIMANEGNPNVGEGVMTPGGMSREGAFDGIPQGALANALMFQPPQMVTPASPAPMRPGVQLAAPKPTAQAMPGVGGPMERPSLLPEDVRQMAVREAAPQPAPEMVAAPAAEQAPIPDAQAPMTPARAALRAAESELDRLNNVAEAITANGQPLPPDAKLQIDMLARRVSILRAEAAAEDSARVPAEIANVLDRQAARLEREEGRVNRAEKNASADALIKAGLALMNPQRGANFLSALSGGVGAGLETYDAALAAAAERRARLGERQDAITLQRYDALTKARDAARAAARRGEEIDQNSLNLINASNKVLFDQATMDSRISEAQSTAKIKGVEAQYAPLVAEANIAATNALRDARKAQGAAALLKKGDGGGPKGAATIYSTLTASNTNLDKILSNPLITDPAIKKEARDQKARNNAILASLGAQMGLTPPAKPQAQRKPAGRIISATPIK